MRISSILAKYREIRFRENYPKYNKQGFATLVQKECHVSKKDIELAVTCGSNMKVWTVHMGDNRHTAGHCHCQCLHVHQSSALRYCLSEIR
jgi:hypothetical protein